MPFFDVRSASWENIASCMCHHQAGQQERSPEDEGMEVEVWGHRVVLTCDVIPDCNCSIYHSVVLMEIETEISDFVLRKWVGFFLFLFFFVNAIAQKGYAKMKKVGVVVVELQ